MTRRADTAVLLLRQAALESRIAALEAEQVELRRRLLPQLPTPNWLSVEQAAALVGRSEQTVRAWARAHELGTRDVTSGAHMIDRAQLRQFYLTRFGVLPAGLRDERG